jgi:hypothetical protein
MMIVLVQHSQLLPHVAYSVDDNASARIAVATTASASAGVNPAYPIAIRYIAGPPIWVASADSATSGWLAVVVVL